MVFARLSTRRIFGPAIAGEVERLHPDLQVLDARDVHAADEQHLVGRFDQREHVVVELRRECRRPRSRTSPGARCRRSTSSSPAASASVEHRLGRRGQDEASALVSRQRGCASISASP